MPLNKDGSYTLDDSPVEDDEYLPIPEIPLPPEVDKEKG